VGTKYTDSPSSKLNPYKGWVVVDNETGQVSKRECGHDGWPGNFIIY